MWDRLLSGLLAWLPGWLWHVVGDRLLNEFRDRGCQRNLNRTSRRYRIIAGRFNQSVSIHRVRTVGREGITGFIIRWFHKDPIVHLIIRDVIG